MNNHIRLMSGKLHANRFMRFLVAGGINTLFGFAVYSVAILLGAAVWLALLIGMVAGTIFNFFTVGQYVFRQLSVMKFPAFIVCYLTVYGVNLGLIEFVSQWSGEKILAQFILAFPMAALSYFLMVFFVFPERSAVNPPPKP